MASRKAKTLIAVPLDREVFCFGKVAQSNTAKHVLIVFAFTATSPRWCFITQWLMCQQLIDACIINDPYATAKYDRTGRILLDFRFWNGSLKRFFKCAKVNRCIKIRFSPFRKENFWIF